MNYAREVSLAERWWKWGLKKNRVRLGGPREGWLLGRAFIAVAIGKEFPTRDALRRWMAHELRLPARSRLRALSRLTTPRR